MSKTNVTFGPGLLGCFALLFTYLKLTSVVNWSWWLVLCPVWVPAAFGLFFLTMLFILLAVSGFIK